MALHAEPSDLLVAATEFRAALEVLGITSRHAARLFAVNERSARRWRDGSRHVPHGISLVCRLLIAKVVTVNQVEQAAAPVPARINGRAEPAPEEQPALAPLRAKTAALADGDPTTAEKVCALTAEACRWPHGAPGQPGFRFCGNPIARGSYCKYHHRMAYLPPRTGSRHGVRVGFLSARQDHGELVAHGRQPALAHGSPSTSGAFPATGAARPPISRAAVPGSVQPPA
jgi:hypothetical protein